VWGIAAAILAVAATAGLALARGVEVVREPEDVAPWPVRPGVQPFSLEAGRAETAPL
jgi:hypothetical protein